MTQLEHIEAIEKRLWKAADTLRANSNYASNEYFMPVMGLIFLRHAYSRYLAVKELVEPNLPTRGGKRRPLTKEDFSQRNAIFLRPHAQFDHLVGLSDSDDRARAVIEAMESIEDDYTSLRGVLPIVCAMWLTGFDVPSLSTLYLDKPLKAHTLMQAIARANRLHEGKNNGLVVDYCGILRNLRRALATFAGRADAGHASVGGDVEIDPVKPEEELLEDLAAAIGFVRAFLGERGVSLGDIVKKTGFERIRAIVDAAKEAANENDETRKRFEVMCREVFRKFRSSINLKEVNAFRADYAAIDIIYKKLQEDREKADVTDILRKLHEVVDEAIDLLPGEVAEAREPFDISRIDFGRLRAEFERSPVQRTTVQNLRQAIESRLRRLLEQNPTRMDLQRHYEELVARYNREKDRLRIEETFAALLELVQGLDEEETRHLREGLDDRESLAVFDLLKKPSLSASDVRRVKKVAVELLDTLKKERLGIDHWTEKESTRDGVRVAIRDFLWSEETGLPESSYTEEDVEAKTEEVYVHVLRAYPRLPSPVYGMAAV